MRPTAYMTAAHYAAYGVIDRLEVAVGHVRSQMERDYRGRRLNIVPSPLSELVDQFYDALSVWEEEDEDAPTVDEAKSRVAP